MADYVPHLPTEIWIRVLDNHRTDEQHLTELWTACRHVNSTFKEAVETIFRDNVLPKTWIRFDIGGYEAELDQISLKAEYEFTHLSEDKLTAIFKLDSDAEDYYGAIRWRLEGGGEGNNMSIEEPQHTVQVRHEISDGPIPGASFDHEKFELSCNWRELYTAFYGELQLTTKLDKAWVKTQEFRMEGLKRKMERGELDMIAVINEAATAFEAGNAENLKTARRARMKHQYKLRGIENWDPDTDGDLVSERIQLAKLRIKRENIDLQDMSDEEDEEGGSSDESDDEWEDEEDDDARSDDNVD